MPSRSKSNFWRLSIATELQGGVVALVLLSLLGLGGSLIYSSFRANIRHVQQIQKGRSQVIAIRVNARLEGLLNQLEYVANVPDLMAQPATTQELLLNGVLSSDLTYEAVAILTPAGEPIQSISAYRNHNRLDILDQSDQRVVTFVEPARSFREDWLQSPAFREAIAQQKGFVFPAEVHPGDHLSVTLAVPVINEQNQLTGILTAIIDLSFLDAMIAQPQLGKTGYAYIIDHRRWVIANRLGRADQPKLKDLSSRPFIQQLINAEADAVTTYQGLENADVVGVATLIPQADWYVVVEISTQEAYGLVYQLVQQMSVGLGLSLVLTLGIVLIFSRQITLPLQALTTAAREIQAGKRHVYVKVESANEMGILANAFNQMAEKLRLSFQALEENNQVLEKRVTERTARLMVAKEEAEAANRAKSEFLANMSHELRTPLNGILGYTQILQVSRKIPPESLKQILTIHDCGEHLLHLINDVLDIAKIEAQRLELEPTEVLLVPFLEAIVNICRVRAEQKGVAFVYQPAPDLPIGILVDGKRLKQILLNVLGNAIKFTDQGQVTFTVLPVATESSKVTLRFQVEDTGIGIAPEQLQRIFLPFEQVGSRDRMAEGTGLGLAISHNIATMMGGTLQGKSRLGEGSIFCLEVTVPQTQAPLPPTLTVNRQANALVPDLQGFEGDRRRILVVDDHADNRAILVNMLEPLGFEMAEAANGKTGLTRAKLFQPDMIITDLLMPGMNGFELIRHLRQVPELKDVVVIAASASVSEASKQESLTAGAQDFLAKPISVNTLLVLLQQHLGLTWVSGVRQSRTD
ncbi:MAG: response regulator [Leptolyngbya sp. RL_3_1]|nr:response regulator [Leptolyngbya sp. RL_3_1]